jgi:hypothetical protein
LTFIFLQVNFQITKKFSVFLSFFSFSFFFFGFSPFSFSSTSRNTTEGAQKPSEQLYRNRVPPHAAFPVVPPSPLPSRQQPPSPFLASPPPPLSLRRAPHDRQSSSQVWQWPLTMEGLNQARFSSWDNQNRCALPSSCYPHHQFYPKRTLITEFCWILFFI